MKHSYSVVVIGGGHAGCEASLAAARMGVPTLLITMKADKIAEMSCNPSIGGVGKGQLVKEIDALGGEMGKNADYTGIQFKRLNTRKGSAVQSSRCQSDKKQYALRMQEIVRGQDGLDVLEGEVKAVRTHRNEIAGLSVRLGNGILREIGARSLVITAGTFMRGLMHCGFEKSPGGRFGEKSSQGLSDSLRELGFTILRLKTGTPPRLLRHSIDFSEMERQDGDVVPRRFSFSASETPLPQVPCFLTYTSPRTHEVIRENLSRSPLYSGEIKGIGPRYCPSIEDKVVKFPEKGRHQLFFEPEALDSDWIYPNGISTSLPPEVQEGFLRTLPGCADVKVARYGYAVEYDCIDPRGLEATLEARHLKGLFLAGQVNGTSGYEEAAAQGLLAGINAAQRAKGAEPFTLARSESYLGVMVDDLVTHGVSEPYRMFTSRAEFRLSLREDNADLRLRPHGRRLGLISDAEWTRFEARRSCLEVWAQFLKQTHVRQGAQSCSMAQLLRRPELGLDEVLAFAPGVPLPDPLEPGSQETLEVELKYEGYIALQKEEIERLSKMQALAIPAEIEFGQVAGISNELKEKLNRSRPGTLAEAARISGMTPAALTALLFHVRQKGGSSARPTV